jgi:hypothetical protein
VFVRVLGLKTLVFRGRHLSIGVRFLNRLSLGNPPNLTATISESNKGTSASRATKANSLAKVKIIPYIKVRQFSSLGGFVCESPLSFWRIPYRFIIISVDQNGIFREITRLLYKSPLGIFENRGG